MKHHFNVFGLFVEVLSYDYIGGRHAQLTGEMISASAELSHLLGRTKGRISREVWGECFDQAIRFKDHYDSAWRRFTSSTATEAGISPRPGQDLANAFREAVDGTHAVLRVMTSEARRIGIESWVYEVKPDD